MIQPKKVSAQENSDSLRREAYKIIQHIFKVPEGFDDLSLNRLVDCIISAAVLQVAALQEKAIQQNMEQMVSQPCKKHNMEFCSECYPAVVVDFNRQ